MTKMAGSGAGSVIQRYDPRIWILTKMSQIPNTGIQDPNFSIPDLGSQI
jgi:hypothetical protein